MGKRTNNETEEDLRRILVEQLCINPDEVFDDAYITKDLGADSLDIIELTMAIEQEFDIQLPPIEELQLNMKVSDLQKLILETGE